MQIANLEDIHKPSPVQLEMLAHSLAHPGDDTDVLQVCVAVSGSLDLSALEAAWQAMAARHSALRTAFRPGKVPSQVVQRQVKLPFAVEDRGPEAAIASFLAADRERGFDPAEGPLVRLSVLRSSPTEHLLVWTCHRLVLDGRSAVLLAGQTLALARNPGSISEPGPVRKFREYIDWLRHQDFPAAEKFWRQELAGVSAPSALSLAEPAGHDARIVRIAPETTEGLRSLADRHGLAFETLVQGAWALVLSRQSDRRDVLFGITAPGRPAALTEAESRIGRFAHTLPLRIEADPHAPLLGWLRRLEERRIATEAYGHLPVSQIRDWSGLPSGVPLFHSRLTVFPGETAWVERPVEPLALIARIGTELVLEAVYDRSCFPEAEIVALQDHLVALLSSFAAGSEKRLEEILDEAPAGLPAAKETRLDRITRMVLRRSIPATAPEEPTPERRGGHEIVPVSRDQPLPATFYQEWALQLDGVTQNSIPSALRITGPLQLGALRQALLGLLSRHEALRTSFRWEDGEAYLELAPSPETPHPIIDLSALPEERGTELLHRLTARHSAHEFDMARGPLFIAQIVRLGDRDHALLMSCHHLISDGWSIQVLHRELLTLYAAFVQGRPSPLPPLSIQLADFAWWQRRVYAREALTAQLAWWRSQLASLPPPPALPNDLPRPEVVGTSPVEISSELASGPTQALRDFALATRSSLPMVIVAAIDALLHAYSGEEDLIVSLLFAGRNRPELSGQIGLYMNTVPLRADLSGNPTFRQLVERVRDATIDAYSHQDVPFPRLLAELFPGRKLTRTLLSGVCFNMLSFSATPAPAGAAGGGTPLGGLSLQHLGGGEESGTKHDLVVSTVEAGGSVHFELMGAADLFTPGRMDTMMRDFEALLARVIAEPDIPLAELRKLLNPA